MSGLWPPQAGNGLDGNGNRGGNTAAVGAGKGARGAQRAKGHPDFGIKGAQGPIGDKEFKGDKGSPGLM